jgi:DNA-binding NarL/FixJ family response regulator
MENIRILLADDHELVRYGVRGMLEQEEDMQIVGDCSSAEYALSLTEITSPNIILMDTDIGGIEVLRHLRQKQSPCKVILLTLDKDCLAEALEAGVAGYLLEDINCQELVQAIRSVHHGELVIDERLTSTPQAAEGKSEDLSPEDNGSDIMIKEVELVIPPPVDAAQLLRFISHVEEGLEAAIMQEIGSWNKGTAITIVSRTAAPLVDILHRLEKMPEVEGVIEKPAAKYNSSSLPLKIIAELKTRFRKEFQVTLK